MQKYSNDSHLLHSAWSVKGLPPGGTWGITFLGELSVSSGALPSRLDLAVDCSVSLKFGCMPYPVAA